MKHPKLKFSESNGKVYAKLSSKTYGQPCAEARSFSGSISLLNNWLFVLAIKGTRSPWLWLSGRNWEVEEKKNFVQIPDLVSVEEMC